MVMAEAFVLSFVEKLMLLEKKTGSSVHYRIMPPILAPFHDCISIQKVARQIADSIGLSQFTFIIAFAKQKQNVGGHIDLRTDGAEVFIEIDPDAVAFPDSVGATLCHEICHKWLQVMGISSPIEMDNEILTDITAVFLGFGKIMLNGCNVKTVRKERVAEGTRTTTETRTSGYLKRDQLAFAYRLVCGMRNVARSEYMQGLSSEAVDAVRACDGKFGHYYDARFHQVEPFAESLKNFQTARVVQQTQIAELNKHLEYVKQSFCEITDSFVKTAHSTVEKLRKQSESLVSEKHHDPALRFLHEIQKDHELERMTEQLHQVGNKSGELLKQARVIGRHIWMSSGQFPAPSGTMFNIVRCPIDRTKLRLPENSAGLVVVCPTCHYRFAYDTTCLSFETAISKTVQQKLPLWRRVLGLLKRQ